MKLSIEARQARNEYFKKYRKNNPEKIKTYNENYWNKKASEDINAETRTVNDR